LSRSPQATTVGTLIALGSATLPAACHIRLSAGPATEARRKLVGPGADDQSAEIDSFGNPQSDEPAERQPAHLGAGLHELRNLVDRGLQSAPIDGHQIGRRHVPAEHGDLELPRAGARPEPVQEDERQETGSDSVIQMLASSH
jgi:hypothetical protein